MTLLYTPSSCRCCRARPHPLAPPPERRGGTWSRPRAFLLPRPFSHRFVRQRLLSMLLITSFWRVMGTSGGWRTVHYGEWGGAGVGHQVGRGRSLSQTRAGGAE